MTCRKKDIAKLEATIEALEKQHEGDVELIRVLVIQHEQDEHELSAVRKELAIAKKENAESRQIISNMADDIAAMKRILFGTSSEKSHATGDQKGGEGSDGTGVAKSCGGESSTQEQTAQKTRRTRANTPGKRDYSNIPVDKDDIIILEPDSELIKGARLMKTEEHWRIFYRPGYLFKVLYKRRVYSKEGMVIAPKLPWVPEELRKRRCDPSLVAGILVNKYCYHIPYERQLQMLSNSKIQLAKSTLNDYGRYGIDALEGLYQAIREKVLSSDRINIDETVQYIVDADNHRTRNGYDWGFVSPQYKMMYFTTSNGSRSADVLDNEIREYTGKFIQSDGFSAYGRVSQRTGKSLIQIFCMAHIRRKFWDCRQYHMEVATQALHYINRMLLLEKLYRKRQFTPDETARRRNRYLRFLLDRFKAWLDDTARNCQPSPQSYIGKAINYAKERIDSFYALCRNGVLAMTNNMAERCMRGHTLGRKNYLFVQNGDSADRTCKIYTIIESCKMCGINPYKYLVAVLSRSPEECMTYEELLPCNIKL